MARKWLVKEEARRDVSDVGEGRRGEELASEGRSGEGTRTADGRPSEFTKTARCISLTQRLRTTATRHRLTLQASLFAAPLCLLCPHNSHLVNLPR